QISPLDPVTTTTEPSPWLAPRETDEPCDDVALPAAPGHLDEEQHRQRARLAREKNNPPRLPAMEIEKRGTAADKLPGAEEAVRLAEQAWRNARVAVDV